MIPCVYKCLYVSECLQNFVCYRVFTEFLFYRVFTKFCTLSDFYKMLYVTCSLQNYVRYFVFTKVLCYRVFKKICTFIVCLQNFVCYHVFTKFCVLSCFYKMVYFTLCLQSIYSGWHHDNPKPPKFLDLSLLWEGALFFCFDLAKVFLYGATMPPLHPKI